MPQFNSYIKGFSLYKGEKMKGYHLNEIKGDHIEIVRYREYKYLIVLSFERFSRQSNPNSLLKFLKNKVKEPEIIYTRWGNPYKCYFGSPKIKTKINNFVTITSTGYCKRILNKK
uniref:Uncharacterized protein n=1 Tax=Pithovirus LCPAC001 TaxID=2506585 RepID=A0A481Z1N3_9VIRU|nr:MAG: uncharacterized protein LCPAC001_01460 [Pithovirus LCPAC001]